MSNSSVSSRGEDVDPVNRRGFIKWGSILGRHSTKH